MKIAIGSDHRGFELKAAMKLALEARGIETVDVGTHDSGSVDYPDFADQVAREIQRETASQGVLICGSGLGMAMAANKSPWIRAALCLSPGMARMARAHNDANVLVFGADTTTAEEAGPILDEWLKVEFEGAVRHKRRIQKMKQSEFGIEALGVYDKDPEVHAALKGEGRRQQDDIVLIASENLASRAVLEAQGSVFTNKYAEGYPGERWYCGCQFVDDVERLAVDRAKQVFGAEHANLQPHSGSTANMIVYFAALEPGDTILAMKLSHGGHLTHGHSANFSGRFFNVVSYGVNKETEQIDYEEVASLAREHKPRLIVCGCSSYSRIIDFKRFRKIADDVGAYLMADIAHIAGLIAAGCHPSPVSCCEFVTGTSHKTMRGPRGGFILCQKRFAEDIDRQVFPGVQGGPLMHVVAAKAICFYEALRPSFRKYQQEVVKNSRALADALAEKGHRIVSGGTDNHLALVDLSATGVNGRDAAQGLEKAGIVVNKNVIPFDTQSPSLASGIRVGTPVVTSRGMGEEEMQCIAELICKVLKNVNNEKVREAVRETVADLTTRFPADF